MECDFTGGRDRRRAPGRRVPLILRLQHMQQRQFVRTGVLLRMPIAPGLHSRLRAYLPGKRFHPSREHPATGVKLQSLRPGRLLPPADVADRVTIRVNAIGISDAFAYSGRRRKIRAWGVTFSRQRGPAMSGAATITP